MNSTLLQRVRVAAGVAPQDIAAGVTGPFVSIVGAGRILAAVATANLAAGKKVTVQFKQATSAAGAGAKDLGAPVDFIAPAGGAAIAQGAEVNVSAIDDGFEFVAVNLTTDAGAALVASASLLLGDNRFNP